MAEDWRLTVQLAEAEQAGRLVRALHDTEVADASRFGGRVAVSSDANRVFLYADGEADALRAREIVERVLKGEELAGSFSLDRWHHEEELWEPAAVPLPASAAEHEAERQRFERLEEAESESSGIADWEVRIELPSHDAAHELGERLEQEGFRPIRRWTYLLVGAADEDDARALAARLQSEAPSGSTVHVEPGSGVVWQLMPSNPFAVLGGLGG